MTENEVKQELFQVVREGDLERFQQLFQLHQKRYPCRQWRDLDDNTLLHKACQVGNFMITDSCIGLGCDINAKNLDGQTALHIAASSNSYELIRLLLFANANKELTDLEGNTPLHCIVDALRNRPLAHSNALYGSFSRLNDFRSILVGKGLISAESKRLGSEDPELDALRLLTTRNPSINVKNKIGDTALHLACEQGWSTLVECLLDNGARVNLPNKLGQTPLKLMEKLTEYKQTNM
ncbi:hypothetical protein Ciccas_003836 [Cichlidogyrus casuarinus]|uniref:Uncharacterized protein n=1 Tax=Cichlidogyrus casuarinus TaxID=1844966 RepID=A0ABD2QGL3_9PLAT